jgi:hypothetical protein
MGPEAGVGKLEPPSEAMSMDIARKAVIRPRQNSTNMLLFQSDKSA